MFLSVCPTDRLSAQSLTVIGQPGLRTRVIRQHQFAWQVAYDTAAGGIVARNFAIGAFTFTGPVRIEGMAPYSREPELPGYNDSARFESDGRVVLVVADSAARGGLMVEPRGIAGANAGRLLLRAASWPANRVVAITIEPLDLFVTASRAGYAERDRVRLDDGAGVAYVSDPAANPAVIAIALGRGARGRLQSGMVDVLLERDFAGATGRERRNVNRLALFVEPDRVDDGTMSTEVLFGLGRTEAEALAAARGGTLDMPARPALPRIATPSSEVTLALAQLSGAAAWVGGTSAALAADLEFADGPALWQQVGDDARRIVTRDYGRTDSVQVDAARLHARLVRGLFGVETGLDQVAIAPRLDGVDDGFTWRVEGVRFGADSLAFAYRPADRRATIGVVAARRVRLLLRFSWLTSASCVEVRRGQWPVERLPLVVMSDGSAYADVRSGYDPATVTVSAAACGG